MKRAETSQQARAIAQKVEHDIQVAADAAVRVAKLSVRIAITPKIELARKFLKAVLDDEGDGR